MYKSIVLAGLLAVLSAVHPARSQEARGTILGRVTDLSGAVVPSAAVRVTNLDTGVTSPVESNQQGNYTAPLLIPGRYRVTGEKAGFKRFERSGIELSGSDRLEVNISLEVGDLAETVTVTAETPLLDTASASLGRVVDSVSVADLPIPHGNVMLLMRTGATSGFVGAQAGATRDQPYEPINAVNYSLAGSSPGRAEITLDGANNTYKDQGRFSIGPAFTPPQDAVAEVKIEPASFNAITGFSEGGTVAVSLKSGTNVPHGSLYWVNVSPRLKANDFFANAQGKPLTKLGSYNREGAKLNGPVY
jgi:hypothetical protein